MLGTGLEGLLITNQVICRHDYQQGILTVAFSHSQSRMCDRRGGIATFGLQYVVRKYTRRQPGFDKMILAGEIMLAVGHRDDFTSFAKQGSSTLIGFRQQRLAIR